MQHPQEDLMRTCIRLAEQSFRDGQYAIAALVVNPEGQILASSGSTLKAGCDPTNHPEMAVIRRSSELLHSRSLEGCYLYTTLEPCPMCTSAAIWAKMKGIVFGALQEDAVEVEMSSETSGFSWRQIHIKAEEIIRQGRPVLELYPGFMREECKKLFSMVGRHLP